jgi:hypothetical protein
MPSEREKQGSVAGNSVRTDSSSFPLVPNPFFPASLSLFSSHGPTLSVGVIPFAGFAAATSQFDHDS